MTSALEPGLRTRAFVFNTLLVDKSIDDRLRHYDSWIASRNLSNEASDESVDALVTAVQARYDIPQRWYTLKAKLLGLDKIADYDRMASVASVDQEFGWSKHASWCSTPTRRSRPSSPTSRSRFFDEAWIDAPVRPGKRPGAFCAYTVPSRAPVPAAQLDVASPRRAHARARDGPRPARIPRARPGHLPPDDAAHAGGDRVGVRRDRHVRAAARRDRRIPTRGSRCSAESLEGQIATVFRQVAMNRFEDRVHNQRRDEGELSSTSSTTRGPTRRPRCSGDVGRDHRGLPHVVVVHPALHGHARIRVRVRVRPAARAVGVPRATNSRAPTSCRAYLELLAAGGSRSPEELGRIVGLDLADPAFWDGGLEIVAEQLAAAEAAATEAGRL